MTAIQDIGAEAAKLLTGVSWTGRRVIELGSMVSPDELAVALGTVLGREVKADPVPREAWVSTLEKMGFPNGQTWAFEEVYDGVNAHWIGFGAGGTERVEGKTSALEVFAAAQKSSIQFGSCCKPSILAEGGPKVRPPLSRQRLLRLHVRGPTGSWILPRR